MQFSLFDNDLPLPAGLHYHPDFLSEAEETDLLTQFAQLPFQHFQWHGYTGKRRTVAFGWSYNFDDGQVTSANAFPDYLLSVKARAAHWARVSADALVQGLVTEYQPGAGIGWHRDAPPFGIVLGISLQSDCSFQLRIENEPDRRELHVARRSIYALTGPARTLWQHSIPPAKEARFSITFRTLRTQTKTRHLAKT